MKPTRALKVKPVPEALRNVVGVRVQASEGADMESIFDLADEAVRDASPFSVSLSPIGALNLSDGLFEFDSYYCDRPVGNEIRQVYTKYLGTCKALEQTVRSMSYKPKTIRKQMIRYATLMQQLTQELLRQLPTTAPRREVNLVSCGLEEAMMRYNTWREELNNCGAEFKANRIYDDIWDGHLCEDKFSIITDVHLNVGDGKGVPEDKPTHMVFFIMERDEEE